MLRHHDVRIAAEPGELHLRLLARGGELALVVFQRVVRLVVVRLRDGIAVQERGGAVGIELVEIDLRRLRGGVADHALVVLLHRLDRQRRLRQISLGIVDRDLELARIEPVKHLPGRDVLVIRDVDVLDDAGYVSRDADLLGADIGVVGRHDAAAGDVPVDADQERDRHQGEQYPARPVAPLEAAQLFGRRSALLRALVRRDGGRHRRARRLRRFVADGRNGLAGGLSHSGVLPRRRRQRCVAQ